MNTLFEPGKPLNEQMRQIVSGLHDRIRSHIVLVTADDSTLRREAFAELARQLSGQYVLQEFDYTTADLLSLPRFCRTLPRDRPVCVFGSHLEKLKQQDAKRYETALHFLNAHREDIRLTRTTVVLWLTVQTYKDLWAAAPDFADWRTTDVNFSLPDGWRAQETQLGKLSLQEAEELRHQIRRFEDMLARDGLEPAMRAELEKQRAQVFAQLGQERDSRVAVEASSQAAAALGDYRHFADLYRQHVIDRFGKLTLYSISSDTPLAVDLEQVFVKLTAVQSEIVGKAGPELRRARARLSEDAKRDEWSALRQEKISALLSIGEALAKRPNLVILGAPGSGKTTLLRYLALSFARHQAEERLSLDEDRLPLLITLRDFSRFLDNPKQAGKLLDLGPQLLPQFLNHHTETAAPYLNLPDDFFSRQLDKHNCIVLFDGLDEVADPIKRGRAAEAIATFVHYYRRNRFVVSSRPRGYEGEARQRLASLCTDCTIRDFDDEDMRAFATNWYTAVTRERLGDNPDADVEAHRRADDLLRSIRANERVKALAHTPLLLSVLAMVHQRGVGLPQRRAELYDECTDMLLGYWDQVKGGEAARELASYGELGRSEKRTLLEPIALWFHERGEQGVEADKKDLEQEVSRHFKDIFSDDGTTARHRAAIFLRVIEERTGLLVEREAGVYAFAHLTFQEYLAARALADCEDYIDQTLHHLHDPWWREVILLEVGHLSEVRHFGRRAQRLTTELIGAVRGAKSPLEDTLKRDLLFAARALADIGPLGIDEKLRHGLLDEILDLWYETPYSSQRYEVGELLSYTAPTVSGKYLSEKFQSRLKAPDSDVRWAAADALGNHPTPAATEALLTALKAPDSDVRRTAALALGNHPTPATTEALLTALKAPDSDVRRTAADALRNHPTPATTEALLTALKDSDSDVRRTAALALGNHPTPATTEALLTALKAPDSDVRRIAARALRNLATPATTEALLTALKDSDSDVRRTAADALRNHPTPATTEALLTALKDSDSDVRRIAALALGNHPTPAATEALLTALKDSDSDVRRIAARALGDHPTPAATEALLTALKAPDSDVRWAAADALGNHPTPVATEALLTALKAPDSDVRWIAALALGDHPTPATTEALLTALKAPDSDVRWAAADALGNHPTPAAREALLTALKDSDSDVRRTAADALRNHPTPAATEALLTALKDSDSDVRRIAARALRNLATPAATEALLTALKDSDSDVRRIAARALRNLATPAAREALLTALKDSDSDVRRIAARALGDHPTPTTTEALLTALKDSDSDVRRTAADALRNHPTPTTPDVLPRLKEFWESQLQEPGPPMASFEYVRETAYIELHRIADLLAFSQR